MVSALLVLLQIVPFAGVVPSAEVGANLIKNPDFVVTADKFPTGWTDAQRDAMTSGHHVSGTTHDLTAG